MRVSRPKIIVACACAVILIASAAIVRANNYNYKISNTLSYVSSDTDASTSDTLMDSINASTTSTADLEAAPAVNQTDDMSQKLFASLMVLQTSGSIDDQSVSDLATSLASEVDASVTPTYQMSDLTIIDDASVTQTKDFANKFWTIRQKYIDIYAKNPIGGANFIADPTDPHFADSFVATGNLYIQMADDLSKLPVPQALVDTQLQLLNNYIATGLGLKKMDQINSDPISTISGLNTFSQYSDYETTILEIMAKYFSDSGIIFTSTDPGIGWNSV